jgi:GT2 family glycosyltransferase
MISDKLFVVIVNWNGKQILKECLTSFFDNTQCTQCSVVVVDNGSSDGSVEMLEKEYPSVKLIRNSENLGFSKANNQGINFALTQGAKFILLLNNDIEISQKNWLTAMVDLAKSDKEIGIVGCKLLYPNGRIQHAGGVVSFKGAYDRGDGEKDVGQYNKVQFVDYVTGAAFLIKTEVIRNIGLLDEGFSPFYFEDTDWCARARFYGYKVVYTPTSVLIHKKSYSMSKLRKKASMDFYIKKNWIRFFLLNFQFRDIIRRVIFFELNETRQYFLGHSSTGKIPFSLRKDAAQKLLIAWKAWAINIRNLKDIVYKRRQRFNARQSLQFSGRQSNLL